MEFPLGASRATITAAPQPGQHMTRFFNADGNPDLSKQPAFKIPESVLVVIHTADLQVLLIERADRAGFWQSVTGSKDFVDEPGAAAAIREVAEETGIVVGSHAVPHSHLQDWGMRNVYEIYPVWRHRYSPGVTHNSEQVFGLQVPHDIAITLAPREHVGYEWLPWREAADRCFSPSNAEAVLQLPRFVLA